MSYERGDVVWGPAPNKTGPAYRPWVLVSDSSIPFADEESIALGMTTSERTSGIRVPNDAGSVADHARSPTCRRGS